ncbi:thioredoxin family protein [Inhella gelatinilytica]|uniref:Thioredoxin family protein n=1 Tax=Inhella gelatinilytica TaxID=2795030 RepID=A0A931IVV4_9BURK|nr:thioredoxin family protein [Inhella gelatinilytica]MBH9552882.1 thioredoxin family protein [Inhella gelatinilytica]
MNPETPLDLYCLCAAWCGTCRGYEQVLQAVAAQRPGVRIHWVDIEDQAERVGDVDVETFPTLLLAEAKVIRFFGPVLPHEASVLQLLDRAHDWLVTDPEATHLLTRLRAAD